MMNDPIVDEVHKTRQRIFEECGNSIDGLIERLKSAEAQDKQRLVTLVDVQERFEIANTAKDLPAGETVEKTEELSTE